MKEGDEAAFRALYRRYTPALYASALRLLGGDEAEAEDVVQDTWIRATRALPRFRWEASLRTWLTGIALNRTREILRRRSRRPEAGNGVDPERATWPDPVRRMDVEEALAALPDGYRTVLVLHDVEGYTHPEISRRLEIAVGTSRSQLHHARRALRRLLDGPESTGDDADAIA